MNTLIDQIEKYGPCDEAVEWLADRTLEDAWCECPRGDWMLWLATQNVQARSDLHRAVVRAAAACAELALPYAGDLRGVCEDAIHAARVWAGRPSDAARSAAYAACAAASAADAARAARAADAAYASDAVRAAADAAAYAARAAARTAADAVDAAARSADAVDAAAADDAGADMHARCAEIVRREVPLAFIVAAIAPPRR